MPRVSVFDWYTRTSDDKAQWAIEYFMIDAQEAELIDEWATPIIDEETWNLEIIDI